MGRPLSFPDGLPYFSRSLSEDKCRDDVFCSLTPKQRFERLSQQIAKTFSLPLTFANPDFNSLRQDQYFGVRHQKVSSSFAAYMLSTGYSAEMTVGSKRTESVSLIFVLDGVMSLSQNGNFGTMRPGQAYLFNAARPAQFNFHTPFEEVIVGIPRAVLSKFLPNLDRYTALPIAMTPNFELLRSLIFTTANTLTAHEADDPALQQLSDTFASLAGFALASAFRPDDRRSPHRDALLLIVQDFMRHHLDDPDINPAKIASANHMSERALFDLFKRNDLSVMDWLWEVRLSRARELLSDPKLSHLSAAEVAYCCGFKNTAHFSTRFKKAFSLSPTEYRIRSCQALRNKIDGSHNES